MQETIASLESAGFGDEENDAVILDSLDSFPPAGMVQNSRESGYRYWATCSFIRSLARGLMNVDNVDAGTSGCSER